MSETIGEYRVIRPLGKGGMAEVFVVEKLGPAGFQAQLCLKRIRRDHADNMEFVKAFEAEARIISRLRNSNIVQVSDFFRHGDDLCLVMELIEGMDLSNIIKAQQAFPVLQLRMGFAFYVLQSLLMALQTAHEHGVIHRDISPHNLLISTQGAVKLADFGVAKAWGLSEVTRTGVIKGKLCYMPPEQMRGGKNPIGPEADLFAAGVVFWEMLADDRLFKATMEHQIIANIMAFEKASIPSAHPKINVFLHKILAPDPSDRFHSAEEALNVLTQLENTLDIHPSTPNEVGRTVRQLIAFREMSREKSRETETHVKEPSQHTAGKHQIEITPERYDRTEDNRKGTDRYETRTKLEESGTRPNTGLTGKRPAAVTIALAAGFIAAVIFVVIWLMVEPSNDAETDTEINRQEETAAKALEKRAKDSPPPVEQSPVEKTVKLLKTSASGNTVPMHKEEEPKVMLMPQETGESEPKKPIKPIRPKRPQEKMTQGSKLAPFE